MDVYFVHCIIDNVVITFCFDSFYIMLYCFHAFVILMLYHTIPRWDLYCFFCNKLVKCVKLRWILKSHKNLVKTCLTNNHLFIHFQTFSHFFSVFFSLQLENTYFFRHGLNHGLIWIFLPGGRNLPTLAQTTHTFTRYKYRNDWTPKNFDDLKEITQSIMSLWKYSNIEMTGLFLSIDNWIAWFLYSILRVKMRFVFIFIDI